MRISRLLCLLALTVAALTVASSARAEGDWEITPESQRALRRGLEWLEKNQGSEGNWQSNDLGLVGMGALAFMADGHAPGRGRYGRAVQRPLDYILRGAKPQGLLNIADQRRDMYNHGLATFVLGQAYGMTDDRRLGKTLEKALDLIANTQCGDGGWDYVARRQGRGHDLSLAVMQAKALRSAVDSGLDVRPEVINLAIQSVREHYSPQRVPYNAPEERQRRVGGQFTYGKGGGGGSLAMAAAGVVCLQEFGQYDDWRIPKSMEVVEAHIRNLRDPPEGNGEVPFDPYTLNYVGQALYQVGGDPWARSYPKLRDYIAKTQIDDPDNPRRHGSWRAKGHVGGLPGEMYSTAIACFILAMPNRYLPILQEGRIEAFNKPR